MKRPRSDAIDALRGVAILLVVLYHAGPLAFRMPSHGGAGWLIVPPLGWRWLAVPLFHFGFTGVHLFFVLSGFCIHLRAARDRANMHAPSATESGGSFRVPRLRLRAFFLRRFWRIYPPYWIALALFAWGVPIAAALPARAWPPQGLPPTGDVALHATMLHAFFPSTIFSINPAFWSLATEEQFYLAYPLVALALARFGARRVLAAALALSLAWRLVVLAALAPTPEHFMLYRVLVHAFFLPRWFEWILGCWLAELACAPEPPRGRPPLRPPLRAGILIALGAALLAAGMACRLHVAADKLASDALFSSGYAAIVLGAMRSPARAGAAARALAAVGRRAYGTYLMHQPILDWVALSLPLRLALAALASATFSRLCERPFERRSQAIRSDGDGDAAEPAPRRRTPPAGAGTA